jgi:DNA-binding transcriptional regulator YiaG
MHFCMHLYLIFFRLWRIMEENRRGGLMATPKKQLKATAKLPGRAHAVSAKKARNPVAAALRPARSGFPRQVLLIRQRFGLSRKMFSRLSGYSERAIAEWETGKSPSDASRQRMVELERLQHGLTRIMKADFVSEWLQTPNEAFDGLKPVEVIERGEIDRLWRMVYLVESGVPG